jgi:hypothetical protein
MYMPWVSIRRPEATFVKSLRYKNCTIIQVTLVRMDPQTHPRALNT